MKSSKGKAITEENPLMLLQAAASLMDPESIGESNLEKNLDPVPAKKKLKSSDLESSREHDINEFKEAAAKGDLETVNKLLNVKHIHPGVCNNIVLMLAAKNGHYHICKRLLEDCRTNPTDQKNYAIRMAVRNGHLEILKLFLDHSKADPSADCDYSIRVASFNGHVEIVKLLLKDPRVDPTVKEYYPIRYAAKNKHWEIVDLLIQDSRVNIKHALAQSKKNWRSKKNGRLIKKLENILINGFQAHAPVAADPIHHKIPNKPLDLPLERQKSIPKEVETEKMIPKHDPPAPLDVVEKEKIPVNDQERIGVVSACGSRPKLHDQTPIKISTENPLSPISNKPSLYSPINLTDDIVLYASRGQKPEIETIVKDLKSRIIQAIITSAERGDVDIIQYLLKEFPGLDFNASDSMALKNAIEKHRLTSLINK